MQEAAKPGPMTDMNESPINPLPTIVILLALAIIIPEIAFQAAEAGLIGGDAGSGLRFEMMERFGFFSLVVDQMSQLGIWPLEQVARFATYSFLHLSFLDAVIALMFVLAMGKWVGERFAWYAVAIVFFGSAFLAALGSWLLIPGPFHLVGSYPAVYGLIGAYTFLYWLNQVATDGPRMQAFGLIVFLMGIHLLFGLFSGSAIGWLPRLFGFFAGFGISFFVVPGGFQRLVFWLRNR